MSRNITIKDIEPLVPFSRGSTEIFLTGHWSGRKPLYVEKTSPCREACPIGNDIARAFSRASDGAIDEALMIFREENPLPGVCGRVCYHPCQSDCNRKDFDEGINIRGFERYLSDHGRPEIERASVTRKERVAVVGSGPAGLSAAYHLARLGYAVTVFEALPEPGGMLMYGIPEYRLPKEVLRREIGYITEMGVEIRTGVRVGTDIPVEDVRRDYQALFLAIGAHAGARLGVEGEETTGVFDGIGFLRAINLGQKVEIGPKVAVIGGGNTAVDCARTARRLGASDVTIIYRRSRDEMPALAEDVEACEAEGKKIEFLAAPERIIVENGRHSGIACLRMELGPPDASGRPQPIPLSGSGFTVSAHSVITAVGQAPETDFLKQLGLQTGKGGIIQVSQIGATGVEAVFAGGDGAGTKAFVADAIASGKMGALSIHSFFQGRETAKEFETLRIGNKSSFSMNHLMKPDSPIDLKKVVPFKELNTICSPYAPRQESPGLDPEDAVRSFGETASGLDPAAMKAEIERCFKCGTCTRCDFCFLICPDISIIKAGEEGYVVRTDYCKGCGVCATSCPRSVIEIKEGGI